MRALLRNLSVVALLFTAVAAGGSDPTTVSSGRGTNQDVRVPVVLDGDRFLQPSEFNALYERLKDRVTFRFVVLRGEENVLYAFTSFDRMNAYLTGRGIKPPSASDAQSPGASRATGTALLKAATLLICEQSTFYSFFYDGEGCSGVALAYPPGGSESDLRNVGFNDRISAVSCTTNTSVNWCTMFEHIFFDGMSISIQRGVVVSDLGPLGWSDRASSLILEGN